MKKVLNIIGARPQFIKAAMLSRAIRERNEIKEIILHTGQHYDRALSEDILNEIGFPRADYNLGINQLSHGAMVGRILEETEKILLAESPDVVVVYGDTNSTLAGALAARKLNISVAHIEAGMRSNNERMPEETNRILTDRMSRLLFCSSDTAIKNLEQEGFLHFHCSIINSGDLMYDAFKHFSSLSEIHSSYFRDLELSEFVLCTIHRESNVDDFEHLSAILTQLDIINREVPVVLPAHPRTIKNISASGLKTKVKLIPPASYLQMQYLLKKCALVITDSGGLQREAYFAGKPCMVLRTETEWIELIETGYSMLVGNNLTSMQHHYRYLMENPPDFKLQLYGNGKAAEIIAANLIPGLSGN